MGDPHRPTDQHVQGWFVNLLGWLSFLGLFAIGVVGLIGGAIRALIDGARMTELQWAGVAYLLLSGLAFGTVLALVLRHGPRV